jgi:hypothetical protein
MILIFPSYWKDDSIGNKNDAHVLGRDRCDWLFLLVPSLDSNGRAEEQTNSM